MKRERAVLAGVCFRGMQYLTRRHDGVISTRVSAASAEGNSA